MAGKIRVKLTPTTTFLTPAGNGTFRQAAAPAKGAFPVVTSVKVSLEQNNGGTMPIAPGKPGPAQLDLLGRQRTTTNPTAPYTLCGTLNGNIALQGGNPVFTAKKPPPSGSGTVVTDFTRGTAPDVTRSDFIMDLTADDVSVKIAANDVVKLQLPWVFDETDPVLQLNARLRVGGNVETDVTGNDANQPIDLPLKHEGVADEGLANQLAAHPILSFYGLRTVYPMGLLGSPKRVTVSSRGVTINVFIDSTVASLVPGANMGEMRGHVQTVLRDAGFATVNVDSAQTAQTNFQANFKQVRAPSQALWFMSRNVLAANEARYAANMERDAQFTFQTAELVQIPFFDFYVCSQNADPPRAAPDEMGHNESLSLINPPNKSILAPIVLTAGSNNLSGLRRVLANLGAAQKAIAVSQVICHEIGHTLGLRHVLSFTGAPPYKFKDASVRGSMGGLVEPPAPAAGATPEPFQFFGPVHRAAIRQWYA